MRGGEGEAGGGEGRGRKRHLYLNEKGLVFHIGHLCSDGSLISYINKFTQKGSNNLKIEEFYY